MTTKRISSFNLDRLLDIATRYQREGWRVEKPIYIDWWWRGYSILLRRETDYVPH